MRKWVFTKFIMEIISECVLVKSLFILNLYNIVCQLYINKTGEKAYYVKLLTQLA